VSGVIAAAPAEAWPRPQRRIVDHVFSFESQINRFFVSENHSDAAGPARHCAALCEIWPETPT
jgi:hypothetical protein